MTASPTKTQRARRAPDSDGVPPEGMTIEQWTESKRTSLARNREALARFTALCSRRMYREALASLGDLHFLKLADAKRIAPAFADWAIQTNAYAEHNNRSLRGVDWAPAATTTGAPPDVAEVSDKALYQLRHYSMLDDLPACVSVLRRFRCSVTRAEFPEVVTHLLALGPNAAAHTPDGQRCWLL